MIDTFTAQADTLRAKIAAGAVPDSRPASSPRAADSLITIVDDVLVDPLAYRAQALTQPFQSVPMGPVTFHGIAACVDPRVPQAITARYLDARPTVTFFRHSPEGQPEPNFIHTDRDMGDWTGILYLNPDPPADDGTTFWKHRASGATASVATSVEGFHEEWLSWRDRSQWEPWRTVSAKFNRLLLFHAPLFHSRAIDANYGTEADARLIQIVFGTGLLWRTP